MNIYSKIKKYIRNPLNAVVYINNKIPLRILPDSIYLRIAYRAIMKEKLHLSNPRTFNEKLQWLKLYDRKNEYIQLVDKYDVRKYIKEQIGEEYLIPILGIYNNFDEIDFDKLPNKFVLKPTHTSGDVYICKDKSNIDYIKLKKEINRWLRKEYYWVHREWPYKYLKARVICEEYMVDESGIDLKDYKFLSFNGTVKCAFVASNRNSPNGLNVDFYDTNWSLMPFERHYPNSGNILPSPKNLNKMIKFAELLSKDKAFLRVDFYEVKGKLYFGELTFYPGAGFEKFNPETYDYVLGSWIKLPIE